MGYPIHAESTFYANPYPRGLLLDSYDPCYAFVWCDYCESSAHDACTCPYRDFDAQCASMEKRLDDLTDKMLEIIKVRITEYSHCFSPTRENCT